MLLRNTYGIKLRLVTLLDIAAVVYMIYICRHKWEFKFTKITNRNFIHNKQLLQLKYNSSSILTIVAFKYEFNIWRQKRMKEI